ncbi:MAG: hypothetical protein KGQ41_04280 [Alphaproteobacteria bacterium]|nr:hypothetical protein [Alphaproteobacteria bacterium]
MAQLHPETRIKLALASLNQTNYDFAHNVMDTLVKAIDKAVADGATILAIEELGLSAYYADDYHQWYKNNDILWPVVQFAVGYAAAKNPNLILSLGVPWYYADKSRKADDDEYNRTNRLYNTQMLAMGGQVLAISAKSILADGPAEYEPRQFRDWPISKGTIHITLPDGSSVPFGKPVVLFGDEFGRRMTVTHEQCAEGWPGVNDDLTINDREQLEARHIVKMAEKNDISVCINPSASKPQPAINKERIRMDGLCVTGSRYCGVFAYVNCLGSDSGSMANEGSMIFAQDGQIIHHGQRYSFADYAYSSVVVDLPPVRRAMPDVSVHYDFREYPVLEKVGGEAAFDVAYADGKITDAELSYEEYLRTISLWLRDYLGKPARGTQGYVISLSGGKDSAYGAIAVSAMADFEIAENGLDGFFAHFTGLKYEAEAREIAAREGQAAAVKFIKKNFLTCIYIATDISSDETEGAARFLVEGGTLDRDIVLDGMTIPAGTKVEGIGGDFIKTNIQPLVDEEIIAASGIDLGIVVANHFDEIMGTDADTLPKHEREAIARARVLGLIKAYVNTGRKETLVPLPDYITRYARIPVPTWNNPADDITLQNLQARLRLPIPWTVANKLHKMPLVTSNASEGVLGYSTAGGDGQMGGANPIGGITKDEVTASLKYFAKKGVVGFAPLHAVLGVLGAPVTAELRKEVEGEAKQTDESDLGFSYAQSDFIEGLMITGRQTPMETLRVMVGAPLFKDQTLYGMRDILVKFAKRWEGAQFKRIMSVLSPHTGRNPDPHQSVRTTVLGDHFHTLSAHMTLQVLEETLGSEAFEAGFGMTLEQAKTCAILNNGFKLALYNKSMAELEKPETWKPFEAANRMVLTHARDNGTLNTPRALKAQMAGRPLRIG